MAKEVLELEIKSDIKGTVKDVRDLNSTLSEQKKILLELQQEEIKLERERSKMSDYQRGLTGVDKQLEHIKLSIKDQKLAVKGLTAEQREANQKQKEYNKELKETENVMDGTIGNFKVFGVSLNGIKKSITGIIPLIKTMFRSITAGIMSTGIGAFVIAFGSLVTFVTTTKEGMDKLNVVLARVSATFNVLKDRFTTFGKAVFEIIKNPITGFAKASEILEGNLSGVVDEMKKESAAAAQLALDTQALRDADNAFMVQKALTRKEIEKARLLSEDETKSAKVRLDALKNALALEQQTTDKELELATERMRIFKEDMEMNKHKAVDETKLAELTQAITMKEIASLRLRKRVMTEVNEMQNEINAQEKEAAKEKQDAIDADFDAMMAANDEWNKIQEKNYLKEVDDAKKASQKKKDIFAAEQEFKEATIQKGFAAMASIAGEDSALSKGVAAAQTIYNTQQGIMAAMAATSVGDKLMPYPVRLANAIATGVMGAAALQNIMSTDPSGKNLSSNPPPASSQAPAPQMISGAFDLAGGTAPEAIRAFVVTDEMTDSQNQLANIRRRATI